MGGMGAVAQGHAFSPPVFNGQLYSMMWLSTSIGCNVCTSQPVLVCMPSLCVTEARHLLQAAGAKHAEVAGGGQPLASAVGPKPAPKHAGQGGGPGGGQGVSDAEGAAEGTGAAGIAGVGGAPGMGMGGKVHAAQGGESAPAGVEAGGEEGGGTPMREAMEEAGEAVGAKMSGAVGAIQTASRSGEHPG